MRKKVSRKSKAREITLKEVEHLPWTHEVVQKKPFTMVRKTLDLGNGEIIEGVGFSKVCWPDKYSDLFGIFLAETRANNEIADKIIMGD